MEHRKKTRVTSQPFYELPSYKQTSVEVIAEARQSVKSLPARRPYTPAEPNRTLFGKRSRYERPPSNYSIGSRHFTDELLDGERRAGVKLAPLEKLLAKAVDEKPLQATPPCPPPSTHRLLEEAEQSVSSSTLSSDEPLSTRRPAQQVCASEDSSPLFFWEQDLAPVLCQLVPGSDPAALCGECDQLLAVLWRGKGLVRDLPSKKRKEMLRRIFNFLDCKDPELLLKLSKVVLVLEVVGKNLLNICKLLFSVIREGSSDQLFIEEGIAEPLLNRLSLCDPVADSQALVYGVGTIKLMASNAELRGQLNCAGVFSLLSSLIHTYVNKQLPDDHTFSHQATDVLVQVTGALRNLADSPNLFSHLKTSLVPLLPSLFASQLHSSDIVFNVSRLLSKLTLDGECQEAVTQCPGLLSALLQVLLVHQEHADIVVRVGFVLGNVTATCSAASKELFSSHQCLPLLISIWKKYFAELQNCDAENSKVMEDVLIKVVRFVANLSVHPEVGSAIASSSEVLDHLIAAIDTLPFTAHRDLVVTALATLNNLSYYSTEDSCFAIATRHMQLAESLEKVLLEDNEDGLLESIRVYGNLSRYPAVRDLIADRKVDVLMVTLLDSGRKELVCAVCGVLMNHMLEKSNLEGLKASSPCQKLVDVLRDFGSEDWQLATLVCKVLWNCSEHAHPTECCFGDDTERLSQLLKCYIEEQPASDEHVWKGHFVPVAQNLHTRIKLQ